MKSKRFFKLLAWISLSGLYLFAASAFAQSSSSDIGGVATNVTNTFANIAKLITSASYVAGMGFAMGSILKFKAHKDNPTQVPIGTPIALLFVAAALLFMPSLFGIAGHTVFGSSYSSGGVSGVTTF